MFGKLLRAAESVKKGILPLGLSGGAKVIKPVTKDTPLTYDCVELDESTLAYQLRKEMESEWGS